MAVIHIKNIHNHKIKAGFRNEPLPPYFDGYVDTLTGNIVDPVSNVDTFLQSVKDEVDAKVGNIDNFISKGQLELDDSKASLIDVVNSMTEAFNRNNEKIMSYIFESSQFGGKKEIEIVNGSTITPETIKFIKKIKIDVTYTPQRYCGYMVSLKDSSNAYLNGLELNKRYHVVSMVNNNGTEITDLDPIVYEMLDSKTFSVTLDFPWSERQNIEFDDVFGYKTYLLIDKFDPEKRKIWISDIYAKDYKQENGGNSIAYSHYKRILDDPNNSSDPRVMRPNDAITRKILTLAMPKNHPDNLKDKFNKCNGKTLYGYYFSWYYYKGIAIAPKYTITLMSE